MVLIVSERGTDLKDDLGLSRPYKDRDALLMVLKAMVDQYDLKYIAFTEREIGATNEYLLKAYLYDGQDEKLYETDRESIQVLALLVYELVMHLQQVLFMVLLKTLLLKKL